MKDALIVKTCRKLLCMSGLLTLLAMSSGCSTARPNQGDEWAARLRLGMTRQQVQAELGPSKVVERFALPRDFSLFLDSEATPYDLLRSLPEGVERWSYFYWVSSNTQDRLTLFLSNGERLLGWTKDHSSHSREKYKHEKLTSQLQYEISESEVRKRLGPPASIAQKPKALSRELLVDHYWLRDPAGAFRSDMWIYVYPLQDGGQRKVYLLWGNKSLLNWGYDNAREEAERYLREQGKK